MVIFIIYPIIYLYYFNLLNIFIFFHSKIDEKYYDIGDIYIGYGNPQTNILYLQYKWTDESENPLNNKKINNIVIESKENRNIKDKEANNKLNKDSSIVNKKGEKNNAEKFFNNSSLMISDIKDNTEKSKFLNKFILLKTCKKYNI